MQVMQIAGVYDMQDCRIYCMWSIHMYSVRWLALNARPPQSPPQNGSRLKTQRINIDIGNGSITPVNLSFDSLKIAPDTFSPPLIQIPREATTLHQPLRTFATSRIKRRQHRV